MSDIVNSSLKTAAKGTVVILLGTAASNILWFATKLLIIRSTTVEQLGIYSLVIAIIGVSTLIASLGIHEGATKYISQFISENKLYDAESIRKTSVQVGILSGITVCTLLILLADPISRFVFYKPALSSPLKVAALFIPFNVITIIIIWILRGYGLIRAKVYYIDIGIPLVFLFFLSIFLYCGLPFISILYAYVLSSIIVLCSTGYYGYRAIGLNPLSLGGGSHHSSLLKFSASAFILSVMQTIFCWTDTLMLGRYAGPAEVGIYNISVVLATMLTFPFIALGFVLMPIAGELFVKRQLPELKRTYQVLTKWIFTASLPLFFIFFFFPEMTITFLFGNRFLNSAMPLRILSLGFLLQTLMGTSVILMMVTGLSREIRNISIFGTLLNLALNYIFIKRLNLGLVGASGATMLSYVTISVINLLVLQSRYGIKPFAFSYIRPVFGSMVIGVIIYIIAKALPLYLWMLPLYLILFMTGYLLSLILLRGLDSEDISIFELFSEKTGLKMQGMRNFLHLLTVKRTL